ncbi:hypothetical protein Ahy_A04g021494 isoform B [Arachis hypogaea]|uniref:Squalene monooxygenase n=2 Tax=Arachis hypogaea TaxID=3818 RepID=A0A445DKN6_ARAHY|nr:hypothetical protein Ahy_A04g021494 isoform B [Arachis hypogaea]
MCDLVLRLNHFNFSFTCNNNNLILNNSLFLRIESHSSTRNTHICKGRKLNDSGSGTGADVIIVGAGVAGSALAYTLAKDGRCVHVIEKDLRVPNRINGELLQPGGYIKLKELGLEDCLEQIDAQEVLGYILYKDRENIKLPYPLETYHADVAGRSFHNGRFIQSVQMNEGTVTSLLWKDNKTVIGVQYKSKDGKEQKAYAPLTIVCDGCFSKLRRSLCHPKVEVPSCFVGLILENCQLPFENHGHVILANPSPILFYRISSTEVRCLVDIPGQKVPPIGNGKMANFLKTMVAPQPLASTINTLAGALYIVFSASSDQASNELREACFDYLSLGTIFSSGPMALLSGLNPQPLSLVLHFFAVAIYGVGRLLFPFPSFRCTWIGARLILCAFGIIFPIIRDEGVRQMFFPATVPEFYRSPSARIRIEIVSNY